MRLIEGINLAATAAAGILAWWGLRRERIARAFSVAAAASGVLVLVHLVLERPRWQMVPAYLLAAFIVGLALRHQARARRVDPPAHTGRPRTAWRTAARWSVAAAGLLAWLFAATLPALFPVNLLPPPSGPYAIGVTELVLRDEARPEAFTPEPNDRRELHVLAWYPAISDEHAKRLPLWVAPEIIGPELARGLSLPSFLFDHLRLAPSHARRDPTPAKRGRPYPVLLFNHGYAQGFAAQNSALFEELASHGYVVLSIDHPYEGLIAPLSDGRLARGNRQQMSRMLQEVTAVSGTIDEISKSASASEALSLFRQVLERTPIAHERLAVWVADDRFVLDRLNEIQLGRPASPLIGALNVKRVGMFGMSFGATAAVAACANDTRCDAAVNLDGFQFGALLDTPLDKPVLFMANAHSAGVNLPVLRRAQAEAIYAVVPGSTHLDFTDLSLLSPLFRWLGVLGPRDGPDMHAIVADYVRSFFDRYVRDEASIRIDDIGAAHPEVERTIHRAVGEGRLR